MKIILSTYIGDKENTYLNSIVLLQGGRLRASTKFILDTGSPNTIISYPDSRRFLEK